MRAAFEHGRIILFIRDFDFAGDECEVEHVISIGTARMLSTELSRAADASQQPDPSDPEIRCTCRQNAVGNAGGYPKGCPVHRPGG